MKGLRFVTGEPALTLGRTLVVSDLHIGIEHRYRKKGISLPSQSESLATKLDGLIRKTKAKKLVVLGDIKHRVPGTSFQEEREIPGFFRSLAEKVEVEITPGNHDDGIGRLLPGDVKLHESTGFRERDTWLCHGHAWPGEGFLDCERIVIGHNHAGIEFKDKLGYRWIEKAWVRAELDRRKLEGNYKVLKDVEDAGKDETAIGLPEVVLIPPINDFTGLVASNREGKAARHFVEAPSPLFRAAVRETAKIYMLDGTFLGELGSL